MELICVRMFLVENTNKDAELYPLSSRECEIPFTEREEPLPRWYSCVLRISPWRVP